MGNGTEHASRTQKRSIRILSSAVGLLALGLLMPTGALGSTTAPTTTTTSHKPAVHPPRHPKKHKRHKKLTASTTTEKSSPTTGATGSVGATGATTGSSSVADPLAGCDGAAIASLQVQLTNGGDEAVLTVTLASGDPGYMSAGIGDHAFALTPDAGGFNGSYNAGSPIAANTPVVVGTCDGDVRASTMIDPTPAQTPPPSTPPTSPGDGSPSNPPAGCTGASVVSVSATASGDEVIVNVATSGGDLTTMSALVGTSAFALSTSTGGFTGVLTTSSPVAPGTAVLVGTCSGELQGHGTVTG